MPAEPLSRHLHCEIFRDAQGRIYLGDRSRYRYRELPDNRFHKVVEGDTLFHLAGHYFTGVERAAGLWWVIADFQPTPIHDPTLKLDLGRIIIIPSMRTVMEQILNPNRLEEFAG